MQVVFETYDAAKAFADKFNKTHKRKFSVYRVSFGDERQRFVAAISPKEAIGEAGEYFGLLAERWPRKPTQETPLSILESMSKHQKDALLAKLLKEHIEDQESEDEGEEDET